MAKGRHCLLAISLNKPSRPLSPPERSRVWDDSPAIVGHATNFEPEARHRACWYGRRTPVIPPNLGIHTIEDGQLLFCAHPMMFPVVGYQLDIRNCGECDCFRQRKMETNANVTRI